MALGFDRLRQVTPRRILLGAGAAVEPGGLNLPGRYEALGEALLAGADVAPVCAEIGSALAREGASVAEALDGLDLTYALVSGAEPPYRASRALAVAWADASLEYLHALSCEDPLTGLASLAHVRSRLADLYREGERSQSSVPKAYALVVVELATGPAPGAEVRHFERVLQFTLVAECLRHVFSGGETLGRLGQHRAVAVVRRVAAVEGESVTVLRQLLADWGEQVGPAGQTRVWVEPLPAGQEAAGRLLDELSR